VSKSRLIFFNVVLGKLNYRPYDFAELRLKNLYPVMTLASASTSPKYLGNWQAILKNISPELSKTNLGITFVQPLLKELGFDLINFVEKDFSFSGIYQDRSISVKPDYTCWLTGTSFDKRSAPFLIVEVQTVQPDNIKVAIDNVQKQMILSSATFGLATDGIEIQLWQRYGGICVPRTPKEKVNNINIKEIITQLKINLQKPRRALTAMFWSAKGGVGKTTITGNIGAALSKKTNLKILLVSLDPQGDLNSMFGLPSIEQYQFNLGIADVLKLEEERILNFRQLIKKQKTEIAVSQGVFSQKKAFYLDIIPADRSLEKIESSNFLTEFSLEKFLAKDFYFQYDYILIDAPSTWQGMAKLATLATDVVIPIIDNSSFAVDAIERMQNNYLTATEFEKNSLIGTPPETIGYIINSRFQIKSTLESSVERIQQRLVDLKMVKSHWILPNYADIERSHELGQPVVYSSPNSDAAKKFAEIARDIFV
jgi:cellulose biosynthesis protein BcsQ